MAQFLVFPFGLYEPKATRLTVAQGSLGNGTQIKAMRRGFRLSRIRTADSTFT